MCGCQSLQNITLKKPITFTIGTIAVSVPFQGHWPFWRVPWFPQSKCYQKQQRSCGGLCYELYQSHPAVLLLLPTHVGLIALAQLLGQAAPRVGSAGCPHPWDAWAWLLHLQVGATQLRSRHHPCIV